MLLASVTGSTQAGRYGDRAELVRPKESWRPTILPPGSTPACIEQYRQGQHRMNDASLCHGHADAAIAFRLLANTPGLDMSLAEELSDLSAATTAAMLECEIVRDNRSIFLHRFRGQQVESPSFLEGGAGVAHVSAAIATGRSPDRMHLLTYS